jgi:DNA-binding transcriptional MerR regulator
MSSHLSIDSSPYPSCQAGTDPRILLTNRLSSNRTASRRGAFRSHSFPQQAGLLRRPRRLKITLDPRTGSGVDTDKYMRSGELARECGVSTDTLRHYERIGVLPRPKRTASGYREYPADAGKRVRLVRRALGIGFTLDELAGILQTRDAGGAPCREVRALAESKRSHAPRARRLGQAPP